MHQHEFPDKDDIAGFTRSAPPPAFVPKYCVLDKKVLRFFGHFQETIPDGMGTESTRVRNVHLLYYLEDDTLSLVEPRLHNSGLDQGILIKRHRIPKNNPFQVYHFPPVSLSVSVSIINFLCQKTFFVYKLSSSINIISSINFLHQST